MRGDVDDDGLDLVTVGDIEPPGLCRSAVGRDFDGDGVRARRCGVGDRDIGAFGGEHARGGAGPCRWLRRLTRTVNPLTERLELL